MSSVNEAIVREYFEALGYLISVPCKYVVPGRRKRAEEEIDLIVVNPRVAEHRLPERMVWETEDLQTVGRAVVGIYGWHTERFYTTRFVHAPEILHFAEDRAVDVAGRRIGSREVARILCLPQLPASADLGHRMLAFLKDKGVDGVLTFPTILSELIERVSPNHNYEKSDVLQVLRILKAYDLLKPAQMELFAKPRRRKPRAAPPRKLLPSAPTGP